MNNLQDILDGWLKGTVEPPSVTKLVGIRLLDGQSGVARLELTTGQQHYNPMGIVHGGILPKRHRRA
jgi:acyl-coenzyme A thioesterase PaaI-like protein